jgi:hypothetical protein
VFAEGSKAAACAMIARAKPEASYASTRLTTSNYPGPPLLSQVGGKKTRKDDRYDESAEEDMKKRVYDPATDDEPVSSTDESEHSGTSSRSEKRIYPGKTLAQRLVESEGKNFNVGNEKNGTSLRRGKGRPGQTSRQGLKRSTRRNMVVEEEKLPKRAFGGMLDEEDHELFPFISSSQASKRRRGIGYGGLKNIHASPSSFRTLSSGPPASSPEGKQSPGFQEPKATPGSPNLSHKFQKNGESGFRVPLEIEIESPLSKARSRSEMKDKVSPQMEFRFPSGPDHIDDDDDAVSYSPSARFKEPLAFPNPSLSSLSQDHPLHDLDDEEDDDDESLSSLSSSSSSLFPQWLREEKLLRGADTARAPKAPIDAFCPMCKEPVEPALLQEFLAQNDRRVREQQRFCHSHKQRSAEQEWREKGYPVIDWDTFDERIRGYFSALEKILVTGRSFYRNILDSTMKSGKAKNFRLTISGDGLDNMSCGYYGSKGACKM